MLSEQSINVLEQIPLEQVSVVHKLLSLQFIWVLEQEEVFPLATQRSIVQALLSLHVMSVLEHSGDPRLFEHKSVVHGLLSLHVISVFTHDPPEQLSVVHGLLSLQSYWSFIRYHYKVINTLATLEQTATIPTTLQLSIVQGLLSLHVILLLTHAPVFASQEDGEHGFIVLQITSKQMFISFF